MTVPVSPLHRVVLALALLMIGLGVVPAGAGAVVVYQDRTCAANGNTFGIPPYSLSVASPAATVAGDFLLLSYRDALQAPSNPAGWTSLQSSGNAKSWYRIATNTAQDDVSINMFTGPDSAVAVMARFKGVDPTAPFASTGAQTTGSAGSAPLPNDTGARAGSVRYSATMGGGVSTTFAGMTEICDTTAGSVLGGAGLSAAIESTGVGVTTSRTAVFSASNAYVAQTYILQPPSTCITGGLNLLAPGAVMFPATTLNGLDQTLTTSMPVTVDDQTNSGAGWNVSATSTTFTSGANALPTTAVTITGVTATDGGGRCSAPTNAVGYPLTLPAAPVAPVAAKIFNAAALTGSGASNLDVGLSMLVPALSHTGAYTSTWTLTLASGP